MISAGPIFDDRDRRSALALMAWQQPRVQGPDRGKPGATIAVCLSNKVILSALRRAKSLESQDFCHGVLKRSLHRVDFELDEALGGVSPEGCSERRQDPVFGHGMAFGATSPAKRYGLFLGGRKLYHMGFRQPVQRSTLEDANERRDWRSSCIR